MDTAHACTHTHTITVCLSCAAHSQRGGRGTRAACPGRQPEYGPDAVVVSMRQRGGGPPPLRVTCFWSLGPAAYHRRRTLSACAAGQQSCTDISDTRASCPRVLPSTLFASMLHMQEAENPGNTMLRQGTPQPGACGPAPALENMRTPWTPTLPSMHTHVERCAALLCPRASQSVHASTNMH